MLALLSALAATAQVPASTPAEKTDDPIICTRQNNGDEVGTRIQAKKVCMRKSDRDYIAMQNRQTLQNLNNDGNDRMRSTSEAPH